MVQTVMSTLHLGVLRTADDAERVTTHVIGRFSREEIISGAENLFRTFTIRGVLRAFPAYGGAAGAWMMRVLRELTYPALDDNHSADYEIQIRNVMVRVLAHHRIPMDYVPATALVREGIALLVHADEVVRRLSEHEGVDPRRVLEILYHEALHLVAERKSPEDAYLLPDATVESVVAVLKIRW